MLYAAPSTPNGGREQAAGRGTYSATSVPAYRVARAFSGALRAVALACRARDVAASGGLLFEGQ